MRLNTESGNVTCSHSSACGRSSLATNDAIDSRNCSCSSVKMNPRRLAPKSGLGAAVLVLMYGTVHRSHVTLGSGCVGSRPVDVSVVGLLCRTSDRTPGGARGASELAALLGERIGAPARMVGSAGPTHDRCWQDDLKAAKGCLLEAGGQIEDALAADRTPVLCAADCSIALTTLPTVARCVPGSRVLW